MPGSVSSWTCPECGASPDRLVYEHRDADWPAPRSAFGDWISCTRCGCSEPVPDPDGDPRWTLPYELHGDHGIVECWSTHRLQFEPEGWQRDMREGIRRAVPLLDPRPGRSLHAVYSSAADDACDIENVLLYNVGPGTFAHIARTAIVLERSWRRPVCPESLLDVPRHHVAYSVSADTAFRHWTAGDTLATVEAELPLLTSSLKPASVWLAAARGLNPGLSSPPGTPPRFLLDIELGAPKPPSITTVIKPLLDGLISAFHSHDTTGLRVVVPRIAAATGASADAVAQLLARQNAPLGTRRLVWPWREGVQWNPADDLCVACRVSTGSGRNTMTATLSAASPRHVIPTRGNGGWRDGPLDVHHD